MPLLSGNALWATLTRLSHESTRRRIAVAFVSDASRLGLERGDLLIVNASDEALAAGATCARELQRLYLTGVRLHSRVNLHAKLFLFDRELVVGSCNLSQNSQRYLWECAIQSSAIEDLVAAEQLIEDMAANSVAIEQAFIDRALALPVTSRLKDAEASASLNHLWRLAQPPVAVSSLMQCYFQALIEAQLGEIAAGTGFSLWRGPHGKEAFRAHMLPKSDRLRGGDGKYVLTVAGVEYFRKRKPDRAVVGQFLSAIRSGRQEDLPDAVVNKNLVPLEVFVGP